jgi:prepilin-type N-terminal cleavage/methylation domain-containing protein
MSIRLSNSARRGFTLTEILVAIGVLLAIVLVTGRIFKVMTDVSSSTIAITAIMQDAAAIEKQIRADVSMLTREGFLTVHGVSVPNDINVQQWNDSSGLPQPPLLDASQPADAELRCDQIVFFKEGIESSQAKNEATTPSPFPTAQSMTSMISYGHGIQLPELKAYTPRWETEVPSGAAPAGFGHDPLVSDLRSELYPWRYDNPGADETTWLETVYTDYSSPTALIYRSQTPDDADRWINATQPDARQWVLARQQVLLADDDNNWPDDKSKRQYLNNVPSAQSIFAHDVRQTGGNQIGGVYSVGDPPVLAYGRIDVAASTLGDVRELIQVSRDFSESDAFDQQMRRCMYWNPADPNNGDMVTSGDSIDPLTGLPLLETRDIGENESSFGVPYDYMDQRFFMKDVVCWPRAERVPSGGAKADQPLTERTIGSACSSFIVEWTWAEGVGEGVVPHDLAEATSGGPMQEPPRDTDCWHGMHYRSGDPLLSYRTSADPDDPAWVRDEPWLGQRWFGLRDIERGVIPFEEFFDNYPPGMNNICEVAYRETMAAYAIDPYAIDREVAGGFGQNPLFTEYWATFGLNQDQPDLPIDRDAPDDDGYGIRDIDHSFTPMPTALRFTMTLHDPEGRLEQGVVYQFVVELPRQSQGDLAGGN